jgi:hypothetical protein
MSRHRSQNPSAAPPQHKSSPLVLPDPRAQSSALPPFRTPSATSAPASPRGTAPQNHPQTSSPSPLYPHQSQLPLQPAPSVPALATTGSIPASPPSKAHTTSPRSSPGQPARDVPSSSTPHHRSAPSPTPAPPVAHPLVESRPTAASQSAMQPQPLRTRAPRWRSGPISVKLQASPLSLDPAYLFSLGPGTCTVW